MPNGSNRLMSRENMDYWQARRRPIPKRWPDGPKGSGGGGSWMVFGRTIYGTPWRANMSPGGGV